MMPWRGPGGPRGFRGNFNPQFPRFGGGMGPMGPMGPMGGMGMGIGGMTGMGGMGMGMGGNMGAPFGGFGSFNGPRNLGPGILSGPRFGNPNVTGRGRGTGERGMGKPETCTSGSEKEQKEENTGLVKMESSANPTPVTTGQKKDADNAEAVQAGSSHSNVGSKDIKMGEDVKMETVEQVVIKQETEARCRAPALAIEDEPEYDDTLCILDWYNSDLNLKIVPTDFCSAVAMSSRGFGYMWAGSRATQGATRGRVCYEVRIDNNQPTSHLANETTPNVLRCGWSVSASDMQLGEVKNSYGFGGTSKVSEDCKFRNYGQKFGQGDVVGCYLDMNADPIIIKYTVNGIEQGVAFRVNKSELNGEALFPHILTKNQDFTVNFGQMPGPMFPLIKGYTPIGQLDFADGIRRGPIPPNSRGECEALMMIGLPGAGKTYWAEKLRKENPAKNFNILGTNNLIEKMKIDGLSRKRNYNGRWEELIKLCTECFNQILDLATKRRRNYILDQTNVYPTARGRKMKPFTGFQCKAIVVVPNDQEFRRRVQEREAIEGKEVPDAAVINMKANFVLPEVEEIFFSSVLYTEMNPSETQAIVSQYNAEAITMGQKPTAGVVSFKTRNEQKRAAKQQTVPGVLWSNNGEKSVQIIKTEACELEKNNKITEIVPVTVKSETKSEQKETRDRSKERKSDRITSRGNSHSKTRRSKSTSRTSANRRNQSISRERYRKSRSKDRSRRQNSRSRSKDNKRDSRRRSRSRERQDERGRSRSGGRSTWRRETNSGMKRQEQPSPWLGGQPFSSNINSSAKMDTPNPIFNSEIEAGRSFPKNPGTSMNNSYSTADDMHGISASNYDAHSNRTGGNRDVGMGNEAPMFRGNMGGIEEHMTAGGGDLGCRGSNTRGNMGRVQNMGNNFTGNIGQRGLPTGGFMGSGQNMGNIFTEYLGHGGQNTGGIIGREQNMGNIFDENVGRGGQNTRGLMGRGQNMGNMGHGGQNMRGFMGRGQNMRNDFAQTGISGENYNEGGNYMENLGVRENSLRSSSNMPQQTTEDQPFGNKIFGNQFEGNIQQSGKNNDFSDNRRDQNASLGNTNYGPQSMQQEQNMPRKSLLGLPPPKPSQSNHNSYKQEDMEMESKDVNFDKQQSGWDNQEPFRSFQSRNPNDNRNINMHSNPVQNKDERYGEDRTQPSVSGQNLGGFEQFGSNKSQTSLKNDNQGNEFCLSSNSSSISFNQFGNARMSNDRGKLPNRGNENLSDLNSRFNPSMQPTFDKGMDRRNVSEQAMYQRREDGYNQNQQNVQSPYGNEKQMYPNTGMRNDNPMNDQFPRIKSELNTSMEERNFSQERSQFPNNLGMGRNEDDYRDETNVGYPGESQKRQNIQNHFGEPNQTQDFSINSRGNYSGNKPTHQSFKEIGSNMEMDEYDDKRISDGSSAPNLGYPQNRAQGPFRGNQDYGNTEQNHQNISQNWNSSNLDKDIDFQTRGNSFPVPRQNTRNPLSKNGMSRRIVNEGSYGGEESYQDEGFDGEGGRYEQAGMSGDRGNKWNSNIRGNRDGEKSRSGRFGQRGRYEKADSYQDEGLVGEKGRYGQEGMSGDRRNNLSSINRGNRGEANSRGGQNRKSVGDRRMERDFGSELVKNPFDPSTRSGNNQAQFNRMNVEQFDLPCMNPPAPEPAAPAGPPVRPTGPGTEPGGPDYAKLLQYLQFYQKQMGSQERK